MADQITCISAGYLLDEAGSEIQFEKVAIGVVAEYSANGTSGSEMNVLLDLAVIAQTFPSCTASYNHVFSAELVVSWPVKTARKGTCWQPFQARAPGFWSPRIHVNSKAAHHDWSI